MLRFAPGPAAVVAAWVLLSFPLPTLAQQGTAASTTAGSAAAEVPSTQARRLAELLQDEAARKALVDSLLEIAEKPAAAADATSAGGRVDGAPGEPVAQADTEAAPPSIARRIAQETQRVAENSLQMVTSTVNALMGIGDLFSDERRDSLDKLRKLLGSLGLVVAVTLATFYILRFLANRLRRALGARAAQRAWLVRLGYLLIATVVDVGSAVAAWAAGYSFTMSAQVGVSLSSILFLNAFLVIELVKAGMRALFSPRYGNLRLLPLDNELGGYWGFWINRLIGLLGYGLMLVAPIVSAEFSAPAGRGVGVVVALTGLIIAALVVLQNRDGVRDAIVAVAAEAKTDFEASMFRLLSRVWHYVALVYFLAVFVIWSTRAHDGLNFMLVATLQSAVAAGLGVLLVRFISHWVTGGMRLPADLRSSLPLLERRLNAYVPAVLKVVRLGVMLAVVLAIGHFWGLVDVLQWLQADTGRDVVIRILGAAAMVLVALVIHTLVSSWVEYRLSPSVGRPPSPRERTLLSLFRNAFTVTLVIVTIMLALSELGVNIAPLLAGAGVVGLAVGFGAQKLVQDVITGAFIQFENAMNEGDVVTVAGTTGVVEKLTIRSVGLRDLHGVYHVIPFSSADSVSNYMKGFSFYVAEIGVAYRENVDEVKALMQEAFDRLKDTEDGADLLGPLEMHGLTSFGDSAVNVRARIKTVPGSQWRIGRAYNHFLKEIFDAHDIEIPFPHMTLYMGVDKKGDAPPVRVTQVEGSVGQTT
jgi:small conductance mechanosensitive channel